MLRALMGVPSKQRTDFNLSGPNSNSAISKVRSWASRFCSITNVRSRASMNSSTASVKGKARTRIASMGTPSCAR